MRDARWGRDVWGLLRAVEVPMLASMHGYAVGFGFELALQCDFRIAADDCVVALPEARVGHDPGRRREPDPAARGGHERGAARRCSPASGSRPPTRSRAGFVDEVVPRAELARRARTTLADAPRRPTHGRGAGGQGARVGRARPPARRRAGSARPISRLVAASARRPTS